MKINAYERLKAFRINSSYLIQFSSEEMESWGTTLNNPQYYENFILPNSKKVFSLLGSDVFKASLGTNEEIFFIKNPGIPQFADSMIFLSTVIKSTSRNKFFKTGIHQSMIWKYSSFKPGKGLGQNFIKVLLKNNPVFPLMSDIKQTSYGMNMWISLLNDVYKEYDCYYGLSAPSDKKCCIKIEKEKDIYHYAGDIVSNVNKAYSFRHAFIVPRNYDLSKCLYSDIPVLSCEEAEELDLFRIPKELNDIETKRMYKEYLRHEEPDF